MHKLLQKRGIRSNLKSSRSSPPLHLSLDSTLRETSEWWLEVRCGSGIVNPGIALAWRLSVHFYWLPFPTRANFHFRRAASRSTRKRFQGAFILAKAKGDAAVAGESIEHLRRYIELLFYQRTRKGPTI